MEFSAEEFKVVGEDEETCERQEYENVWTHGYGEVDSN